MNTTTERFSRRLGERVPDATYACAVEHTKRRRMADAAFGFALTVVCFLFGVLWFKGLLPGQ